MARTPSATSVRIDGADLRRTRERAGRSLTSVAAAVGVSPSFLARVERGERRISVVLLEQVTAELAGLTLRARSGPRVVPSAAVA